MSLYGVAFDELQSTPSFHMYVNNAAVTQLY